MMDSLNQDVTPEILRPKTNRRTQDYLAERPSIPVKQSLAYGAPGKPNAPKIVAPRTTAVASAIEEQLEDEGDEPDSPDDSSPAITRTEPGESSDDAVSTPDDTDDEEEQDEQDQDEFDRNEQYQSDENSGEFSTESYLSGGAWVPTLPWYSWEGFQESTTNRFRALGETFQKYILLFAHVLLALVTFWLLWQALSCMSFDSGFSSLRTSIINPFKDRFGNPFVFSDKSYTASDHSIQGSTRYTTPWEFDYLRKRLDIVEKKMVTGGTAEQKVPRVNYFAPGNGIVVDPYLTSPTRQLATPKSPSARFFAWLMDIPQRSANAPTAAFAPWDDVGDCWCAPPSGPPGEGKTQLTVMLPKDVVPTDLVVEHIPMDATLDPGATPKDIELWVEIQDDQKREAVANAAFSYINKEDSTLGPENKKLFHTTKSLDYKWVRVGRWQYNVYTPSYVQTFPVPVPLEHFGAKTNKVAFRALSTWGTADYVCLYRLKLHGLLSNTSSMTSTLSQRG